MSKVPTEKILSLIKDNSNLPFYCLVTGDDVDFYESSGWLQEITDIRIDYITRCPELDYDRVYVKSWNDEDMAFEFYDSMSDAEFNKLGKEKAWQICVDKVESLNWQKCILALASNPA